MVRRGVIALTLITPLSVWAGSLSLYFCREDSRQKGNIRVWSERFHLLWGEKRSFSLLFKGFLRKVWVGYMNLRSLHPFLKRGIEGTLLQFKGGRDVILFHGRGKGMEQEGFCIRGDDASFFFLFAGCKWSAGIAYSLKVANLSMKFYKSFGEEEQGRFECKSVWKSVWIIYRVEENGSAWTLLKRGRGKTLILCYHSKEGWRARGRITLSRLLLSLGLSKRGRTFLLTAPFLIGRWSFLLEEGRRERFYVCFGYKGFYAKLEQRRKKKFSNTFTLSLKGKNTSLYLRYRKKRFSAFFKRRFL